MRKFLSIIVCLLVSVTMMMAQSRTVRGVVISHEDGEPVIGASVLVTGTQHGIMTDFDGAFTLNGVAASAKTLTVSYVGMATQEVEIKNGKMTIILHSNDEMLDEVMVVAYGTAKKSSFTGSAAVMKAEKLEKLQVSNVSNALSGAVAGVQTTSANGAPGMSSSIRIRGIGSLNSSNAPLYVVDGVPFDGDISAINPQDIESMTVLKDAASSALYGARGANGVILITTKKGTVQDAKINVEARWGANSREVTNYKVLRNPNSYTEKLYEANYNAGIYNLNYNATQANAYANSQLVSATGYQIYTVPEGQMLVGMNGKINPYATLGYSDGQYYYTPDNWEDETFKNQLRQEYVASISGGNEKISYYLSAGYLNDKGVVENYGFERLSTRSNIDYQAKKWLKIGTNLSYTNSTSLYNSEVATTNSSGNAFGVANQIAPIYPIYVRNADGSYKLDKNSGYRVYDYGDGVSTNFSRNYMSMSNPISDLLYDTDEALKDVFNGKWYANLTPIEGLTLTASLGLYASNVREHSIGNRYYGQTASYNGSASQYTARSRAFNQQYMANYKKSLGNHNFDVLAGFETYSLNIEDATVYGYNLYKDGDFTVGNVIDRINGSGSVDNYATQGIITRLNYDYNEQYFASFSYRRDASSRFHPDNRWGNFFSASAAWELKKEAFLQDVSWIDLLKVKASFGQTGNDDLLYSNGYSNYYPYIDQYKVTGADGVFSDGTLYYKGNKDITWEKNTNMNVGIDFSLFKTRLGGSVEYFARRTTDMLYNKPVASSNGYSSIPMNIGSMLNNGLEIDLYGTIYENKNIKWSANFNATFLHNEIKKLHPDLDGQLISGTRIYKEGESMYQYYFVKYAGVNKQTGEAEYWAFGDLTDENGDPIVNVTVDENGNEIKTPVQGEYRTSDFSLANQTNRQATGDLLPTVYGGLGTSVEAYGFDFSIQCAYQLGGKIVDAGYQDLMHGGTSNDAGRNWHQDILNSWSESNPNSNIPRVDSNDKYTSSTSDRWIISSNYFAINNLTIGYTIPKQYILPLGIENLRIYFAADNLALASKRQGLDPRQSYTYATTSRYTTTRTITGGIKLTF